MHSPFNTKHHQHIPVQENIKTTTIKTPSVHFRIIKSIIRIVVNKDTYIGT